jgi:hypothetical protein
MGRERTTKNRAFSFNQQDTDNLALLIATLQERSIGSVTAIDALRYAMIQTLQSLGITPAGKPLSKIQSKIPSEVVRPIASNPPLPAAKPGYAQPKAIRPIPGKIGRHTDSDE